MRIFQDYKFDTECPICNTKDQGDAVLIGVDGTQDGRNIEAMLFHIKCLEPIFYKGDNIIAQRW